MPEHKSFFRNMLDAMVESRTRQVARELVHYRSMQRFNSDETAGKL